MHSSTPSAGCRPAAPCGWPTAAPAAGRTTPPQARPSTTSTGTSCVRCTGPPGCCSTSAASPNSCTARTRRAARPAGWPPGNGSAGPWSSSRSSMTPNSTRPTAAPCAHRSVAAEVAELTGLVVERRAEGVALLDVSGRFSDLRFPGTGTIAQAALLLINRMADRVLDVDAATTAHAARSAAGDPTRSCRALDAVLPSTEHVPQQPAAHPRWPTEPDAADDDREHPRDSLDQADAPPTTRCSRTAG